MATLLHSESRRLYSWWWSSHISPKSSKWLQENLTDMDAKVKAMIKLIEEDADSFARRAEMYYKRRPELLKLVEEFYRAYRALAERYNHATVELRQAHRTMAEAFPDQVPDVLADDSASVSSAGEAESHAPENSHHNHALLDVDDSNRHSLSVSSSNAHSIKRNGGYTENSGSSSGKSKKGLKQVHEIFDSEEVTSPYRPAEGITSKGLNLPEVLQNGLSHLSAENRNLRMQIATESERAGRAETEVQTLKNILAELQAEKKSILQQYQQNLEKLSNLTRELDCAQEDARGLNDQASKADIEMKILKEAFEKLQAEREASFAQYNQCLERISSLEMKLSQTEEEAKCHSDRAIAAETESQNLNHQLARLEAEKEAGLLQYRQCLETISVLENKILVAEMDARKLSEQAAIAEAKILQLELAVAKLNEEKEEVALLYKRCLETLARMENELLNAQEDARRLNSEIELGAEKLKNAQRLCLSLEKSNQSLQSEAHILSQKIKMKDQDVSRKHEEVEKLQALMQDERLRFANVEASLETLQQLHYQSQQEQRDLALEIKSGFQVLKDLEMCKHDLEEEISRVKEEKQNLSELNLSSSVSEKNLKNELCSLKEMKDKLEEDFATQEAQSVALQQEICQLQEEIKGINGCYRSLLAQVESVGLNPECFGPLVKELQNENRELKEVNRRGRDEQQALHEKLKNMDGISEKNAVLNRSLSQLNGVLEESREKIKLLQENCQLLQGEKCSLVADKAALLSQLQKVTENLQKLMEKNLSMENSLSASRYEVENLRAKSKGLEEFCQLLVSEKSSVANERSTLASHLENVERRLGSLEHRFENLEEKCSRLEKEKETTLCQIEELKGYLGQEKQERTTYVQSSEVRLAGLENHVRLLQEEIWLRKKEFEEELEKAVNAQVEIFILQKFVEDLEAKNSSLLLECQKHVETSKLSNKLISELESENLEQQVEAEMLSDEIGRLRAEIYRVFRALQTDAEIRHKGEMAKPQVSFQLMHILDNIEHLKTSLSRSNDEEQKLLVDNSILLTILGGLRFEFEKLKSSQSCIDRELKIMTDQCLMQEKDNHELLGMNNCLKSKLSETERQHKVLETDTKVTHEKLVELQRAYELLQEDNSKRLDDNRSLLEKIKVSEEKRCVLEEENLAMLQELNALSNFSLVFQSFGAEKADELKSRNEDLCGLQLINNDLRKEIEILGKMLEAERAEKLLLLVSVEKLDKELHEVRDFNDQLNHQILVGNDFLREKAKELLEVDEKLELSRCSTIELSRTVEELKREHDESRSNRETADRQIHALSEIRKKHEEEIENLLEVNQSLELEVKALRRETEECRIREENLSSELQERRNEFEIWEAEAATFYFDLQTSSVREVLLENKVQELREVCERLRDESSMKNGEIEQMKEKLGFLESEIGGLKSELSVYTPILSSLKDSVPFLKQKPVVWMHKGEDIAYRFSESSLSKLKENHSIVMPSLSDLQKMQDRIEAVEKAVKEETERLQMQRSEDRLIHSEVLMESDSFERKGFLPEEMPMEIANDVTKNLKLRRTEHDVRLSPTGQLMKDIPLDQVSDSPRNGISRKDKERSENQMLEDAWKKSLDPSSEDQEIEKELGIDELAVSSSRELDTVVSRGKILDRLASDAQKLSGLRASVQDMRRKAELKKRSKRSHKVRYETVKRQLEEAEEAVVQLMVVNDHLTEDINVNLSSLNPKSENEVENIGSVREQKAREQARKESEQIGRLQFEVQNINYALVKMEDENKTKGKNRFSRSRPGIILRDFIYSGAINNERRKKKGCLCGCARPGTNGD